jgi:Homeodomain-like domain
MIGSVKPVSRSSTGQFVRRSPDPPDPPESNRARAEGRIGGNRHSLSLKQQEHALGMVDSGKSQSEVAELFKVHRSTICRLVSERRVLAA